MVFIRFALIGSMGVWAIFYRDVIKPFSLIKSAYLMELGRYVVLNPVRARMVATPDLWPWSSYCHTTGRLDSPEWLATDATLRHFGSVRDEAIFRFARFVAEGDNVNIWVHLKQQIYLGDEGFINEQFAPSCQNADDVIMKCLISKSAKHRYH